MKLGKKPFSEKLIKDWLVLQLNKEFRGLKFHPDNLRFINSRENLRDEEFAEFFYVGLGLINLYNDRIFILRGQVGTMEKEKTGRLSRNTKTISDSGYDSFRFRAFKEGYLGKKRRLFQRFGLRGFYYNCGFKLRQDSWINDNSSKRYEEKICGEV